MLRIDLISLGFLINVSAFQNRVHHGDREHRGGLLLIQSGFRRAVAASAAQAGDGDWIINSLPAGRPSGIE